MALIPRELQPHADRVPDRYVFAGPCIDPSRTEGWTPEPGDEPTGPRLYQAVRESLARTVTALELQVAVRAAGGVGNAADAVERLLRQPRPAP